MVCFSAPPSRGYRVTRLIICRLPRQDLYQATSTQWPRGTGNPQTPGRTQGTIAIHSPISRVSVPAEWLWNRPDTKQGRSGRKEHHPWFDLASAALQAISERCARFVISESVRSPVTSEIRASAALEGVVSARSAISDSKSPPSDKPSIPLTSHHPVTLCRLSTPTSLRSHRSTTVLIAHHQ